MLNYEHTECNVYEVFSKKKINIRKFAKTELNITYDEMLETGQNMI